MSSAGGGTFRLSADLDERIGRAADALREARCAVASTGAGISVESGIPPFRGPGGLWEKYDPELLSLSRFLREPVPAWELIRRLFFDYLGKVRPNPAHIALARLEAEGRLDAVITQNIDGLHQEAGSHIVHEYHGTSTELLCLDCGFRLPTAQANLSSLPPPCPACSGLLKPDFIFFGEGIDPNVHKAAFEAAEQCDVMLVVGTTGEVMPAAMLPRLAARSGATVVEINLQPSAFTDDVTDIFLQGRASAVLTRLADLTLNGSD